MATASDIKNSIWGIGIQGYGYIVQGASCVKQRMDIAIITSQGSDPLRPLFGTTIHKLIDRTVNDAIPLIKNEIATALKTWVSDVTVKKIVCKTNVSHLTFNIYAEDIDGNTSVIGYTFTNGVIVPITTGMAEVRIAAPIPALEIVFGRLEGFVPAICVDGINTITGTQVCYKLGDLRTWVNTNWGQYGRWEIEYLNGDYSDDFTEDFSLNEYELVLYTTQYMNAKLSIKKV